jgi:hypothetical protein
MKLMGSRTAGPVRNPQVRLTYEPTVIKAGISLKPDPSIEAYEVRTDKGTFLGKVYLDPYYGWQAETPRGDVQRGEFVPFGNRKQAATWLYHEVLRPSVVTVKLPEGGTVIGAYEDVAHLGKIIG